MPGMEEAVAELNAEYRGLEDVLRSLTPDQWLLPTPAEGWDIRDQVSHLADTNEVCFDTVTGGPRNLNDEAVSFGSPESYTESGVGKGRIMDPAAVLEWWSSTAKRTADALLTKDPKERVPWGLGMSSRMMATARLMEHWAHGGDICGALKLAPSKSPRLRSIAFLTLSAVPYAFSVGDVEKPAGTLRAELDYESETWHIGPEDADNVISGDAFEFCRLGIRRIKRTDTKLKAVGPLAEAALDNLRAFL
ncbi:MAG: maleylpyruvate isomerase family mycothiol-dependent enzyme [Actinomycetota bacterium]|nr:maleylpyruvate isomerase family mycothiol-dependent enzyme [Actinomycetota bacterium]